MNGVDTAGKKGSDWTKKVSLIGQSEHIAAPRSVRISQSNQNHFRRSLKVITILVTMTMEI